MQRASVLVLLALSSVALAAPCLDLRDAPFSDAETKTLLGFFLNNVNIQGQGGVVASPDKQVPGGGSYNYNWMRDGAISMRTVCTRSNSAFHHMILSPLVKHTMPYTHANTHANIYVYIYT
jgi:hypothetical protein